MVSMTITQPVSAGGGWVKFDVNVGGFEIRGCTWHKATNRLRFSRRRRIPGSKVWRTVVRPPSSFVKQLKALLNAGLLRTKRDRSPCKLTIISVDPIGYYWYKVAFKVRGVTILGCRWCPGFGCIQFPITYLANGRKKRVVHAKGGHVKRLLQGLRQQAPKHEDSVCEFIFQCFDRDIQDKKERRKQRLAEASELSQKQFDETRKQLEGQQLPELVPS
jgi:hypothetical protein